MLHQVGDDETLNDIARHYGVSADQLRRSNPQVEASPGSELVIPRPPGGWPTHQVSRGETLWRISKAYEVSVDELRQANQMRDDKINPGDVLVVPRADKPQGAAEALATAAPAPAGEPLPSLSPAAPIEGAWVEVRLPDNRRAWAPVQSLVVGSWQPQPVTRVLEVARSFMGVPYKWGGVNPNGWDCSGFVHEVFRLGGHILPRMADAQYEATTSIERAQLRAGDLVFFNTDGSGVSHVGIYLGGDRFVHASSSRGVVESSLKEDYYARCFMGGRRLPAWVEPSQATR